VFVLMVWNHSSLLTAKILKINQKTGRFKTTPHPLNLLTPPALSGEGRLHHLVAETVIANTHSLTLSSRRMA
jgi:hypothetical protein